MTGWLVLILLTIFLFLRFKDILHNGLQLLENDCAVSSSKYRSLSEENKRIEKEYLDFEDRFQETIALYDMTREICKYLDEERMFACFKEQLGRYISVSDCSFITEQADLAKFTDYLIMPISIKSNSMPLGYLAVKGIKEADKDKFQILLNQFALGLKRVSLFKMVQETAITDTLTNAFTRRYFFERFAEEIERSKKFQYKFSLLMLDVDFFKEHNDRFGHLVGDIILKELSGVIKENIRQIDLLARFGGEEFVIILPETDKKGAFLVAERIRQAVANKSIKAYDEDLKLTLSAGISAYPADGKTQNALLEKADQALYRAKNAGRNQTCA